MTDFKHKCSDKECCYLGQPSNGSCGCHKAPEQMMREHIAALVEALTDLIEAVRRDSDEGGKGISGYTAARLSDARDILRDVGSPTERGK